MLAVAAPACRGAHRPDRQRRRFLLALAGLPFCLAAARAIAGELLPWSDEASPELALGRLDGPAIDLADLRGRPVIVHFFATWCAPCVEELASLDALAERLGTGATILAVDVGEVEARVRNFIRQRPVRFPILLDRDRAAMKRWRVEGLPSSFVLDRDLRPVSLTAEPLDWTSPPVLAALEAVVGAEPDAVKTDDNGGRSTP